MTTKDDLLLLAKKIAKKIDDQVDWKEKLSGIKGVVVEMFDRHIIEGGLTVGINYLPEHLYDEVESVFNAYLTGDFSEVKEISLNALRDAIGGKVGGYAEVICKHQINMAEELILNATKDDSVGGGGPGGDPDD